LDVLSKKTCVLLSTVGPYAKYGEYAFEACAENGTHYVDVTGEVPWVSEMIKKYEKRAQETGAILVPQAGVESAPPDLSTWAMAKAIRTELGVPTKDVKFCIYNIRYASRDSLRNMANIAQLDTLWRLSCYRPWPI
jgi:short subunit dehydrogenase-like uncharacterized protein